MESKLTRIDQLGRAQLDRLDPSEPWSSEQICRRIGRTLADMGDSPGKVPN